jgi:predicted DNA-binding protein (MmcQ/YjbR family)
MNERYGNTFVLVGSLAAEPILSMIAAFYALMVQGLPQSKQPLPIPHQ